MSLLKDVVHRTSDLRFPYNVIRFINPKTWYRCHIVRVQRADRGWSGWDTWDMGDYISDIIESYLIEQTKVMDQERENANESWVHFNNRDKVIPKILKGIQDYKAFNETNWATACGLESRASLEETFQENITEGGEKLYAYKSPDWYYPSGRKASKKQVSAAIDRWNKEGKKVYEDYKESLKLFIDNMSLWWD